MNDITLARTFPTLEPAQETPGLLALSMWMRALFAGASLFVVGIVSVFGKTSHGPGMGVLAVAGLALAIVSLVRTRDILRAQDQDN